MNKTIELNQALAFDESSIDELINDLDSREELLCTGHACAAEAEGI